MADLKPIGSEKLTGQEKIKRIMEIARFKETIPNTINETSRSEYKIGLADGNSYEIVKERQGYIIKKVVSEGQTDYIEPMKNRKYFSSYSQAFKRLNLLAGELNRLNENEEGVSLFGEQKKVVLKTPKPAAPTPAPPAEPPAVPAPELPASPDAEMPAPEGGEMGVGDMGADMGGDMGAPADDMGMGDDSSVGDLGADEKVTFKTIQKLTGKLTQKIRTLDNEEGMTSENIKYVINMVLSSLDLSVLTEEDKEDILSKFEDIEAEEGEDMGMTEPSPDEDMTSDMGGEDEQSGMDLPTGAEMGESEEEESEYKEQRKSNGAIFDSIFGESKVDKVISKYFEISKKEILENREKISERKKIASVSIRRQMSEVKKLVESAKQQRAAQSFLEKNSSATIVGKTNKNNLVFEHKGKQIKISPEGLLV